MTIDIHGKKALFIVLTFVLFITACNQQVEKDCIETAIKIVEDVEEDIAEEVIKETTGLEDNLKERRNEHPSQP